MLLLRQRLLELLQSKKLKLKLLQRKLQSRLVKSTKSTFMERQVSKEMESRRFQVQCLWAGMSKKSDASSNEE